MKLKEIQSIWAIRPFTKEHGIMTSCDVFVSLDSVLDYFVGSGRAVISDEYETIVGRESVKDWLEYAGRGVVKITYQKKSLMDGLIEIEPHPVEYLYITETVLYDYK